MNLSAAIEPFLDSRSDSESTQRTYRTGLGRFQEFMEERLERPVTMDDLYPSCLLDFDMWLGRKGLMEGSRQTYVASVLAFFNNSKLHEVLPSGFDLERAVLIRKDKQKRGGHHSRPAQEFDNVPDVVAYLDSRVPPDMSGKKGKAKYLAALRDRALIWFLYVTGTRQGTARKLKIKQVRDARGDIYKDFVVRSKGDKDVTLFFEDATARQALSDYLAARDDTSPYLFISHDRNEGHPISGTTVWRMVHEAAKNLGFDYSPHDTRHFGAIHRINEGVPMEIVQRWLGHSSIATTINSYAHVKTDTVRDWVKNVPMPKPAMAGAGR